MKTHLTPILLLLLTLTGCTVQNPFVPTTEEKKDKAEFVKSKMDAEINQQTRQLVTGVKEVLESKPESLNKEEQISLDLTIQAERLLGGEPIEKLDINALSTLYDNEHQKYDSFIGDKKPLVTVIKKSELDNQTTIEALQRQLEEEKARRSILGRIKSASTSFIILLILAAILLLIFAPNLLGCIIGKIPSLIFYLGVTSSRVVKSLIKGVQRARTQIAELPEGKKLDKYEILKLIDTGLKQESDSETKGTVDVVRKKFNLESISQRLKNQRPELEK